MASGIGSNRAPRVFDPERKPFSYPELRARVGALLARANQRRAMGRLRVGDLEVHPSSRRVLLRGTPIELSQKEFALLRTLATEPTKVCRKGQKGYTPRLRLLRPAPDNPREA